MRKSEGDVELDSSSRRAHGRPTRARAGEIQSALLAAAMVEFTERGFHGGSIARIAARANVTRATVYKHFNSKEAILERLWGHTSGRLRSAIEEAVNSQRPVWEVLQDAALCFYRAGLSADAKAISRILVMESTRSPELVKKGYERRWYALEQLAGYFEMLSMNGQMALDDAPRAAQQFMHLVTSSIDYLFVEDAMSAKQQERWIASAVRIFLHGALRKP